MGGGLIDIRRVSLFEAYNSVVARVLGQADGKMNEAVGTNKPLGISGGKKPLVSPLEGKSSENLLVVFYPQLPMGRKDTCSGVKHQYILVRSHSINYTEIFVGTQM